MHSGALGPAWLRWALGHFILVPLSTRAKRFVAITLCWIVLPPIILLSAVLFTDWDSSSIYGDICYVLIVILAEWPLFLSFAVFYAQAEPPLFVVLFLYIFAAVFWAALIDRFIVWKRRKWPNPY